MNKSIIKHSDRFKKNIIRKKLIQENVNEFLYRISNAIDQTNKDNKNKLIIPLPFSFNIPDTIDSNKFRIEIYYNIVKILEDKDYIVKISQNNDNNKYLLFIQWSISDDIDISIMNDKLKKISF